MANYSVLIIRPDDQSTAVVESVLTEGMEGTVEWTRVDSLFDALRHIQDGPYDLIISDLFLPDGQGLATVRHLNQHAPHTPVIVLCSAKDRDTAVTAVRKGAHDFFCYEDLDAASLRRAVVSAFTSQKPAQLNGADRRTNARFPCRLAVTYQALEHPFFSGVATSETLNISSKGLLFTTEQPLQAGQLLQVSVDWPARLENQVPLKLVAEGRIVRNTNGLAAMRIDKYEFRTRRVKPQTPGPAAPQDEFKKLSHVSRPTETAGVVPPRPGTAAGTTSDVRPRRGV